MAKKSVADVDVQGKRVLIRVDFNVPQDADGRITDDTRIRAALPTIRHVLDRGGKAILMSHLGRPKEDPKADAKLRMDPVARRLEELLGRRVVKVDACVGPAVEAQVKALPAGGVLLLENLRFFKGEKNNDPQFAAGLAALADVYVNDAFGTCHRPDASMLGVPRAMGAKPKVVGFLVQKELEYLDAVVASPKRPLVGLLGGAKVSDKIQLIERLLDLTDTLLVGGAMVFTFFKAQGHGVGRSLVEDDHLQTARRLLQKGGAKLVLPSDILEADHPDAPTRTQVVGREIDADWYGMDIGPATIAAYKQRIEGAGTVVWNGPMGRFEVTAFSQGTRQIAEAVAASRAVTVVGGGDSVAAVTAFGLADRVSHLSTGGGAFLSYLQGDRFEPIQVLDEKA